MQIGALSEDDTIYLYPYEHKEIWINQFYSTTGHIDVHVELEVEGTTYSADCGFDIEDGSGNFHDLRLTIAGNFHDLRLTIEANSNYDEDETFIVKFKVENIGFTNEPANISILVDGTVVHSVLKDLYPGDVWEYQMSFQYSSAGVHEFKIDIYSTSSDKTWDVSKSVSIGGATETTEPSNSTTTTGTSDVPVFSPGFDLITAVIALLSAIAVPVIVRTRRKK
ncbi:MAG: hypothetical protein ACTSP4_07565 [Candidatus Hodarchaeales archaeon]